MSKNQSKTSSTNLCQRLQKIHKQYDKNIEIFKKICQTLYDKHNSEIILNRYETYVTTTNAILDYYKKRGYLKEINGNQEIDEIYNKIKGILQNIRD